MPQKQQFTIDDIVNGQAATGAARQFTIDEIVNGAVGAAPQQPAGPSPDPRSAGQVAFDQTMNVGRGVKNLVTGIPGAAMAVGGAVKQAATGGGTSQGQEMVKGAVKGIVDPLLTLGKGGVALATQNTSAANAVKAPTDEEWVAAAQASGVNLAGLLVPGALGKVRVKALRSLDPSNLMVSGANTRAMGPMISDAAQVAGDVAGVVSPRVGFAMKAGGRAAGTAAQPFLNMLAKVQEGAAKWLSKGDVGPQFQGRPVLVEGQATPQAVNPRQAVGTSATEGRPATQGGNPSPLRPPESRPMQVAEETPAPLQPQAPPVAYQRPSFLRGDLEQATAAQSADMVPEGLKPPAVRGADLPFNPTEELTVSVPKASTFTAPQVNRWMNVQPKQMVHGANPAKQILDDGLLGPTKTATLTNVQTALKDVGGQMQSVLQEAGKRGVRLNMEDLVQDALDSANKTIGKRSDPAFQKVLGNVLDDIYAKQPDLANMTPAQAHALKVDIGDGVTWGKGSAFEADLNQALVEIYGKVNDAIKTSVPGIGPLQSRWGNLYQGVKSLKNSILRDEAGRGTGTMLKQQNPAQIMAAEAAARLKGGPL